MNSLVMLLGNGRLRTFTASESRSCRKVVDRVDDFSLVREPDGTIGVDFDSKADGDSKDRIRFTNFAMRANRFPGSFDLEPVFRPLVEAVCAHTLRAGMNGPEPTSLYYLVPLNARECFWSSLISRPFFVAGKRVEPRGILDEVQLILYAAALSLGEADEEPPVDVYVVFEVDRIPTACRLVARPQEDGHSMIAAEIFPVHDPPELPPGDAESWATLTVDDDSIRESHLAPLYRFLGQTGKDKRKTGVLDTISWEEILDVFFSQSSLDSTHSMKLQLNRYLGIWDGGSSRHVVNSNPASFPTSSTTVLQMAPCETDRLYWAFRGYFPNPNYCFGFLPFKVPGEKARSTYQVNVVQEDMEKATIEWVGLDNLRPGRHVTYRQELISPPRLFRERNLT